MLPRQGIARDDAKSSTEFCCSRIHGGRTCWWCVGLADLPPEIVGPFGGHGLNTTAMAGQVISAAICNGDDRYRAIRESAIAKLAIRISSPALHAAVNDRATMFKAGVNVGQATGEWKGRSGDGKRHAGAERAGAGVGGRNGQGKSA